MRSTSNRSPDLIVAKREARPAVDNSVVGEVLERLGIPLIYVDSENDRRHCWERHGIDTPDAHRYEAAYRQRLADLQATFRGLSVRMTQPGPEAFGNLDPDLGYRQWTVRSTKLPDAPFVFGARLCGETPS